VTKLPLKWMPAYSHGGPFGKGQPTVVVVHCTESDNGPGTAEALAGPGWFGGSKAGTSSHKVVDVDSICEGVKRTTVAWHAGPGGNVRGVAYEFCGRVAWTAGKWREPAQLQMLRNAAPHIADDLRAMSAPARWLSLAQLGGGQRGLCTHNDIRLAFGGTTHSDPGPNFPYAELLAYVQAELTGTPVEDDMPTPDDLFDAAIFTDNPGTPQERKIRLRDVLDEIRSVAILQAATYNAVDHHGGDNDNAIGHAVSGHKYAKAALDALAKLGAVPASGGAIAAGSLSDDDVDRIADALATKLAGRLES
jgi:hypothetical protein